MGMSIPSSQHHSYLDLSLSRRSVLFTRAMKGFKTTGAVDNRDAAAKNPASNILTAPTRQTILGFDHNLFSHGVVVRLEAA